MFAVHGDTIFITRGDTGCLDVNLSTQDGEISKADGTYTIPAGYHNGTGTVGIAAAEKTKLISGNIKAGVTVLGVSGKTSVVDTADATAAAGTIVSGKTAYVNGAKITGSLTSISVSQDSLSKVLTVE